MITKQRVCFGKDFALDALPDATLLIEPGLGPATGIHFNANSKGWVVQVLYKCFLKEKSEEIYSQCCQFYLIRM